MIYDCITLRDELDLLELRLNILNDKVDKFVISEANYTHRGDTKPYTFTDNIHRFNKWSEKIIYLPVDFSENVEKDEHIKNGWSLENQQRNALLYGLEKCSDNDIIIIGDLDEIPNLDNMPGIINIPMAFYQNLYYYYVNNKSVGPKDVLWAGTTICTFEQLKRTSPQYLRDNRWNLKPIENGGWHWSYLGNELFIKDKIDSIVEGIPLMRERKITIEDAINNFKNLKDIYGRTDVNFCLVDFRKEYPKKITDLLSDQYPEFIYKNETR